MALEPLVVAGDEGPDAELVDMTRRFWIGLGLTLPLLAVVMGDMIPGEPICHLVSARVLAWAQLVLATPVVLKGDLRGIARARRLSRATMRNIRENLFFAFVYNALGVPIAGGVLYPVFGVLLSPIFASAAMTFSSVSVIANALRLRRAGL
jgi:cation transport ATPase